MRDDCDLGRFPQQSARNGRTINRQPRAVPVRAALSVTAYVFHGVSFGPAPTGLFRHCERLVIPWFFSVLQAAKRNGGGDFVAFVRFVSSEKVKLHRCCQITRSIGRAPSIPFGGQGRWWLARACVSGCGGLWLARAGSPNGIRDSQGHVGC